MTINRTLTQMFRYQAWANDAFFDAIAFLEAGPDAEDHRTALRLMNHAWIVADIFAAHLSGRVHSHRTDSPLDVPDAVELRKAMAVLDAWYIDYAGGVGADHLAEAIAFTFTDGDKGLMTREEMLLHVALHGGYHRGEVGRILRQRGGETPWDTVAVFLHRSQPDRRLQGAAG